MNFTNVYGLTDAFVEAVKNDDYDRGESDFTVTQLLKPAQLDQLSKKYRSELTEDVSDRVWSILGQAVHTVLERSVTPSELSEDRLYYVMDGHKIGGQFDNVKIKGGVLTDYKITSVWSAVHGKIEWTQQLNMLSWLCAINGIQINKLQIQGIWKDWNRFNAMKDENYPQAPSTVIEVPMWEPERTEYFMRERLHDHLRETPELCTNDERWYRDEKWALMKEGRKSAVKVEDTIEELRAYAQGKKLFNGTEWAKGHTPVFRVGTYTRCEAYCPVGGNTGLCPQWEAHLAQLNEPAGFN